MKKIILVLICLCLLLAGCEFNSEFYVDESEFNVVTSFYPIYIATSNIVDGIEGVSITNMTNTEVGCLHDYQLTTKDMNWLEKADVFVVNGGGMESFLDKAISAYPGLNVVNSSDGILEEHEHEEHNDGHGHNHGENAHIWVSVNLYIEQVKNIAEALGEYDEENKDAYLKNCEIYVEKLEALKKEMDEGLSKIENREIVTFHEAFDFFAEEFKLDVVAVIEREPGTNPSAGEVAKIIDKIKETDAKAIFVEPQYEESTANVISRETGVLVYKLDPVVTGELSKDAYEKIMRKNLEVLKEALK